MFALAGNALYDWLLAAVVNADANSVSLVADEPASAFAHRAATAASLGFFGLAVGIGLAACKRLALSAVAAANARTWLAIIAIATPVFSFLAVRMRTSTFTGLADATGISVALPLADIPLYQIGVLPGLGVLAYTIALDVIRPHRNHA
ncbi:hypothetical protein [Burkholderia ubonensis]|uniref:Uncharacterized protein n=1 Tax=Burkholderia ubonensis subsp. mesacidophila TaxID=265293 RepID=A0A2A4F9N0_9BURK|nr:hypothetical protein [Burkholderia ubonensis]PCE29370.1 hypothetical protein BZL54_26835 [Burkholderia ubonensis subsp. mesacidophila]